MTSEAGVSPDSSSETGDREPGGMGPSRDRFARGLRSYLLGLALAGGLTVASFAVINSPWIYGPGIAVALVALAIAQIGIHLVFFLHITTDPDNTNNALALAFGVLIVFLVMSGSLWIMSHLNQAMMPMDQMLHMQR